MIGNNLNTSVTSATIIDNEESIFYGSEIAANAQYDTSVSQLCLINYPHVDEVINDFMVKKLESLMYSLLKEGNTKKARDVIEEFADYSSPLLDKWKKSLTRPLRKLNKTASLRKGEIEMEAKLISRYKEKYRSQWVALVDNEIVASNINLLDLKKEIKAIGIGYEITLLKL
ncbi:MAG: hypothetical protein D3924_12780 [Candidatus Electrothrix sp. AR4]|nr:hypothetical protein [Candidatus Electrothrix sp. AR4]